MEERFSRTEMLIGADALAKLNAARVAVFGMGGVGSYVVEALARAGVGTLDLVDSDAVSVSNINRQLVALDSTVGRLKVDVAKERVLDICPATKVNVYSVFFLPETAYMFDFSVYDYVVDAVDSVKAKLELARICTEVGTPMISCMGMGNKLDPTRIEVADISKTSVCPLARVMRANLKKMGIKHLKTVYSKESPISPAFQDGEAPASRRQIPGSISFVPSVAGLMIAGEVVKDLIKA